MPTVLDISSCPILYLSIGCATSGSAPEASTRCALRMAASSSSMSASVGASSSSHGDFNDFNGTSTIEVVERLEHAYP
jgi:hypothetical protein